MSRRSLFLSLLLSPILGLVAGKVTGQNASCKAIPGDAGWPSTDAWNALNRTVYGRLIATVPLPSVCHFEPFGTYNEDACTAMKTAWLEDQTFLNHAAEVMNPATQNYSCVPFTPASQPCETGNYASYSINVTVANDAIAGIRFARENNIRLVIKNTGHEYDSFPNISLYCQKLTVYAIVSQESRLVPALYPSGCIISIRPRLYLPTREPSIPVLQPNSELA